MSFKEFYKKLKKSSPATIPNFILFSTIKYITAIIILQICIFSNRKYKKTSRRRDIRAKNIQILKYPVLELLRFAELRKHKINKLLGWEQAYRYQAFATWKRIIHRHQNIVCPRTLCAVGQLSPMTYCCSWYQSHKMFFFFLEKSEKEYFKGKPLLCFQTLIWVKERAANFSFPKSLRDRPLVILN